MARNLHLQQASLKKVTIKATKSGYKATTKSVKVK